MAADKQAQKPQLVTGKSKGREYLTMADTPALGPHTPSNIRLSPMGRPSVRRPSVEQRRMQAHSRMPAQWLPQRSKGNMFTVSPRLGLATKANSCELLDKVHRHRFAPTPCLV